MIISEFAQPVTAKTLNESLAKRFGAKINLEKFTLEQLQDARNKIRTRLFNVETNESFDKVHNETYQKTKLMLDVLNAEISEHGDIEEEAIEETQVTEGAEDQAELVMAAKEMVDRLTGWMEDTAEMQTESMLELADAIRDEMGAEKSEAFVATVKPALDSMYSAMEVTRDALTGGVGQLTGEVDTPMMGDDGMDDMDMEPTDDMDDGSDEGDVGMDMDAGDDFDSAEPAAGGDMPDEREKRESVDPRKLGKILSKKK